MTMTDLLVGPEAASALQDPSFVAAWQVLYDACPHATAFQSPQFVGTWYRTYESAWQPVVALSRDADGGLDGLLLLAHDPVARELVHAGAHQAEYQTWLAHPGHDASFLAAAWTSLQQRLHFRELRFRFLPSVELAQTLGAIPDVRDRSRLARHDRPLTRLDRESIDASLSSKKFRTRFNRFKRLGDFDFRRIESLEELDDVFDEIIAFYDLRQGAINHVTPFHDDALKRDFHRALFAATPAQVHLTVSTMDGRVVAAAWCTVSGTTAHLGLVVHSPFVAEHSPGRVHLMLLADRLERDGVALLDLTPGGDAWKERHANAHDEVAEVVLYRSSRSRRREDALSRLAQIARTVSRRAGIKASTVRDLLPRLRRARPLTALRRATQWVAADREMRVYRADRALAERFERDPRVERNAASALTTFRPAEAWHSRGDFLSSALSRLEKGESVYSISIDRRLAHHGWLVRDQRESFMGEVQQSMALPPGSSALYDYYTDPAHRGAGLYRAMLGHMLREVFADDDARYAYIAVLADNSPSRHVIEQTGFQYQGSMFWSRRRGTVRTWRSAELARPEADDATD